MNKLKEKRLKHLFGIEGLRKEMGRDLEFGWRQVEGKTRGKKISLDLGVKVGVQVLKHLEWIVI